MENSLVCLVIQKARKITMTLRLTKNFVSLLVSGIVDKLVYVMLFALLARKLPKEDYGAYSLILALIFVGGVLTNLGMELVVIRDVAKNRKTASELLSNSLLLGIVLSLTAWGLIIGLAFILRYDAVVLKIIGSGGIIFLFMGIDQASSAIFKGYQRMEVTSLLGMFNSTLLFLLSYLVLNMGGGLSTLIWVLVGMAGIKSLISIFIVNKYFVKLIWKFDKSTIFRIVKLSFPFALMMVYGIFIRRTGLLMMGWLKPLSEVAIYGAADKGLDFLSLFGDSMGAALFPALAAQLISSREESWRLYRDSIGFFAILGFGGAVYTTIMAKPILGFIFGQSFSIGSNSLIWLSWVFFLNVMGGSASILLFAVGDQMTRLLSLSFLVLGINIILNLILIPLYSYNGVAMAMFFSALIGFTGKMILTRIYYQRMPDFLNIIWRPFLASTIMGITVLLLYRQNILLITFTAFINYVLFLGLLGEFRERRYAEIKLNIYNALTRSR
jgi:O-antigen/teichoic acid export membrane protein